MARLPRLCLPGVAVHLIQRGTNRQACFVTNEDYAAYTYWLAENAAKHQVAIHAFVMMTNHVHLLVTPQTPDGVSRMMQALGRHYVRYFNTAYNRTGTLWEGRFKSCLVETEQYLLACQRYIELNPVRARMVESPGGYKWSSYQANALGHQIKLLTPHEVYLQLGATVTSRTEAYRKLFTHQPDKEILTAIRTATQTGMALGNDKFREEIEALTGRRTTSGKRGPKPRE